MKKGTLGFLVPVIFLSCATLTACGGSGQTGGQVVTVDEGSDTKCEVTGYTDLSSEYSSYFPQKGDKVAVISPSALPTEAQKDATVKGLTEWGFVPVEGRYACVKERTLEDTLEDLEWALTDPEIKAIYCIRGGHASSEVLDAMPQNLIAEAKKPIIGYSDISTYHSAWTVAGLPTIHSSMSAAFTEMPEDCVEIEKRLMAGEVPVYKCEGSKYDKQGTAEGILIGGNLSTVLTVLDTDYNSTETDKPYILFLEDVDVNTEYVHRCMTVLKHKGVLDRAAGIVFGEWTDSTTDCDTYNGNSRGGLFKSINDMVSRQFASDLDIPVAFGFPAGHGATNYPLLMEEEVKLDVRGDGYTLEWK